MGIIDGQKVNQAVTNPAFINKNVDDVMVNQLGFNRPMSGSSIADIQATANKLYTATGASETLSGTTYQAPPSTISDGDSHALALGKVARKFDPATGHTHTGAAGDAPPILAANLGSVPLLGYIEQGSMISAVTGGSSDVSTLMTGKSASSSNTVAGVPVTSPNNKVLLFYNSGALSGQEIIDSTGNLVYGRLTHSGSVWTLTYYSSVEVPYTFSSATDLMWYYEELFNPMQANPNYNLSLQLKGVNPTETIVLATSSVYGKVILAGTGNLPGDISTSDSQGTASGIVANSDHTHKGVHSIAASGQSALYGDVTLSAGVGITLSQVGSAIEFIGSGGGGGGSLQWVEGTDSPEPTFENNLEVYGFDQGLNQLLYTTIRVPNGYSSGNQIKLRTPFYSPDSSGTVLFQTISTLIRTGTDAVTSTTNQRTSSNSAVTLGAGTVNIPQAVIFDLTDSSGKVNGVSVSAGDILLVELTRGTDTGASMARAMTFASDTTFQ